MDFGLGDFWTEESYTPEEYELVTSLLENRVDRFQSLNQDLIYNFKDQYGHSALHMAISLSRKKIFDYLISLPSFPLEELNVALMICLTVGEREDFAVKLIEKGACVNVVDKNGNTLLHLAVRVGYNNVGRMLLDRGVDVNAINTYQHTALYASLITPEPDIECISMLLSYNADTIITCNSLAPNFMEQVLTCFSHIPNFLSIREHVFDLTCDENYEFSMGFIIELIENDSPLFYRIMNFKQINIIAEEMTGSTDRYIESLFSMDLAHLKIFFNKCEPYVQEWLNNSHDIMLNDLHLNGIWIENINFLLETRLADDVIDCIANCFRIKDLILRSFISSDYVQLIYFLLSYGMVVTERDMEMVYDCSDDNSKELFQHLLHQDIVLQPTGLEYLIPAVIYDVHLDFESRRRRFSWNPKVFDYFHRPEIQIRSSVRRWNERKYKSRIPLLTELARNKARKFLVEKFQIRNSSQFYTLLKRLPIPKCVEDVIAFRTSLYT